MLHLHRLDDHEDRTGGDVIADGHADRDHRSRQRAHRPASGGLGVVVLEAGRLRPGGGAGRTAGPDHVTVALHVDDPADTVDLDGDAVGGDGQQPHRRPPSFVVGQGAVVARFGPRAQQDGGGVQTDGELDLVVLVGPHEVPRLALTLGAQVAPPGRGEPGDRVVSTVEPLLGEHGGQEEGDAVVAGRAGDVDDVGVLVEIGGGCRRVQEIALAEDLDERRDVRRDTGDLGSAQRSAQPGRRPRPCRRVGDDLGQHRVVVG